MDPYCIIEYNGHKYKTSVHNSGGKTPKWGTEFEIPVSNLTDEIKYTVMDEDVTSDDTVGIGVTKISSLVIGGGVHDWFSINYKNKQAGMVLFITKYIEHS